MPRSSALAVAVTAALLDEVGIAEAQRLANVLAAAHPVAVLSSLLRRAVSTAQDDRDRAGVDGDRR
ncbi:histidine phosphatase family protein [Nocardia sp. NPDC004604]|uniref:histidine phosphatase family protein n=1 Tax=Nocardia sp. NPDC004604 TaxID=3157013 RepID=UPI0033A62D5C